MAVVEWLYVEYDFLYYSEEKCRKNQKCEGIFSMAMSLRKSRRNSFANGNCSTMPKKKFNVQIRKAYAIIVNYSETIGRLLLKNTSLNHRHELEKLAHALNMYHYYQN